MTNEESKGAGTVSVSTDKLEDGGAKAIAEMICNFGRLKAAVRNLKNMKGRHNTEIAYKRLMEVFDEIDTPRFNAGGNAPPRAENEGTTAPAGGRR